MQSTPKDIFVIKHRGGYLIYAPLAGRIIHGNAACAREVQEYLHSGDSSRISPALQEQLGGLEWLQAPEPPPPQVSRKQRPYQPTGVTLFLTNQCNLACSYCYADAHADGSQVMPESVYQAAIDKVMHHAQEQKQEPRVGFHGGGEPTLAWKTLTGAVAYARQQSAGGPLRLSLATNGTARGNKAEFIARQFDSITLSCDGPAQIQNRQRPYVSGRGSFDSVAAFVETLHRHQTFFAIRVTVTRHNIRHLPEVIDCLHDDLGCPLIHLEPSFASGRALDQDDLLVNPEDFAKAFIEAQDHAASQGIKLRYSAARLYGVYSSFCGCAQDAFNVTPEGEITACFEVCKPEDPQAAHFFFGQFDPHSKQFHIDDGKLEKLRSLTVHHMPHCQNCLAKWNCAGDCPVKWGGSNLESGYSPRCRMNQAITRDLLLRSLERGQCNTL